MIHVAVLLPRYADLILRGKKHIESRLSVVRCDPYRAILPSERIYFKSRGGPVVATALAGRIDFFEDLTPRRIAGLRREFNDGIAADAEYWRAKRRAAFATLIWLEEVRPVLFGPQFPAFHGRAWQRLPNAADVYPRCVAPHPQTASA